MKSILLKLILEGEINLFRNRFTRCYEIDNNNYLIEVEVLLK